MKVLKITLRPTEYEAINWDGSAAAADWVVAQFGADAATITGEGDDRTLTMWGSYEIARGDIIANQWGSLLVVQRDQVDGLYQPAAPALTGLFDEQQTAEPEPVPVQAGSGDELMEETGGEQPDAAPTPEQPPGEEPAGEPADTSGAAGDGGTTTTT